MEQYKLLVYLSKIGGIETASLGFLTIELTLPPRYDRCLLSNEVSFTGQSSAEGGVLRHALLDG
jgi:hypothetical protein